MTTIDLTTADGIANLVGSLGLVLAAVAAVACVLLYARVHWWKTTMGRHLMSFQLVIALTLVLGSVRFFFGDNDFWRYTRVAVFLGVPVVLIRQAWLIYRSR